jgi:hypothetical protein
MCLLIHPRSISLMLVAFMSIPIGLFYGQNLDKYTIEYIGEEDGLPSNEVYHCIEDCKGYMWFATDNGIAKFNGSEFKVFNTSDGLPDNVVFRFYLQNDCSIVGECMNNQYFTIRNDSVLPFKINSILKNQMSSINFSHSFYKDKQGNFHFGTRDGNYEFNSNGERIIKIDTCFKHQNDSINSTHYYKRLKNYVFTYSKKHANSLISEKTRFAFANDDNQDVIFSGADLDDNSNSNSKYGVIIDDSTIAMHSFNNIAIISNNKIINRLDLNTKINGLFYLDSTLYITSAQGVFCSSEPKTSLDVNQYFSSLRTTSIFQSEDDILWITTTTAGILKIDAKQPKSLHKTNFSNNIYSFYFDSICSIIGYENGYLKVNDFEPKQIWKLPVYNIKKLDNNIIVLGEESLVIEIEGEKHSFEYRPLWKNLKKSLSRDLFKIHDNSYLLHSNNVSIINQDGIHKSNLENISEFDKISNSYLIDSSFYFVLADKIIVNHPEHQKSINTKGKVVGVFKLNNITMYLNEIGQLFRLNEDEKPILTFPKNEFTSRYYTGIAFGDTLSFSTNRGAFTYLYNSQSNSMKLLNYDAIGKISILKSNKEGLYYGTKKEIYFRSFSSFRVNLPKVWISKFTLDNRLQNNLESLKLNYDFNEINFELETISLVNKIAGYRYRLNRNNYNYTGNAYISFESLKPGEYILEYSATNDGINFSDAKTVKFTVDNPYWYKWWFITTLIGIILIISYIVYKIHLKRVTGKLELKEKIAKLKIQALNAQLNPHLLFNILNSIQGLVSNVETEKANIYIAKFSKFMRTILNLSKYQTIGIDQEIELTMKYTELESLRFDDDVNFTFAPFPKDQKIFQLPPLTIQPIIENSIKHGVMPNLQKQLGQIKIIVSQDELFYLVKIEDNGIGFKNEPSFGDGLEITKQRLKSINEANELLLENHNFLTTVTIKIKK